MASQGGDQDPSYPDWMPAFGRYEFCPMCRSELTGSPDAEGIERVQCPECSWVYYPANVVGVNVVPVTDTGEVVMILPPGEPVDAPAALPGGVVEYGESPEQAAVREALEETGFEVRVVEELGRWFERDFPYGPMLSFMFEARVIRGAARDSHEGQVVIASVDDMPSISPNRTGSRRAMEVYLRATRQRRSQSAR